MAGERRCESAGELDEEKLSAHRKRGTETRRAQREVFDRKLPLPQHLQHRPPNMLHTPPGVVAQVGRKVGSSWFQHLGFKSGFRLRTWCFLIGRNHQREASPPHHLYVLFTPNNHVTLTRVRRGRPNRRWCRSSACCVLS